MDLLTHHEYKALKMFKSKEMLYDDIVLKIGKTTENRLNELKKLGYIHMSSETDKWGKPQEPEKYKITAKGLAYLEDHKHLVREERRKALCRSVIAPVGVSIITTMIMNSGIIEKILELITIIVKN